MTVPFDQLSPGSKIWIYQAPRKLTKEEQLLIYEKTSEFLRDWTAHGHTLQAGLAIKKEHFLVIGVSEEVNDASGCSIDKSVAFIRELGYYLKLDLLDRTMVAFDLNGEIQLVKFNKIKEAIEAGEIDEDSSFYNHAITTKSQLETSWLMPLKKSWMKKYLLKNSVG